MHKQLLEELLSGVKMEAEVPILIKDHDVFFQAKQWCLAEFGPVRTVDRAGRWWVGEDWHMGNVFVYAFRFENEEDGMAFKLWWS